MEYYEKAISDLKTESIQYFTYTPRHLRGKTLVLKGIRGGFDKIDVKEAISELNLEGVDIAKVSKLIFNRATPDKYHFIVLPKHNSLTAPLWKCKALFNQRCRWDRLKRPPIFQCQNCLRVGHASANCNHKPVCPKCTGEHTVNSCLLNDNPDRSNKYRCTNCDELGHSTA
ncbi:hypothetical protein M0802_007895 [Mischocyttarus mexicanus]|nr:hypothetical protein M0802_007895 [Mischocyttarus mexicanus]